MSYEIVNVLYEGINTNICEVKDTSENKTAVAKILRNPYPSLEDIKNLEHEYEIINKLNMNGIINAIEFAKINNVPAIILEKFIGTSLDEIIQQNELTLEKKLSISINIVETLGLIHQKDIIHKDIKPQNIIVDADGLKNKDPYSVRITDFGISCEFLKNTMELDVNKAMVGTLYYISPEQTGRTDRIIDYRSDYYSFGVMLYEMFTGKKPFEMNDSLELIHHHIAVNPVSPNIENENVPKSLSDIIMKLLAKNPEDRYQSAYGISKDLKTCLRMLKANNNIDDFKIAEYDYSGKINITKKIYGREKEIELIEKDFDDLMSDKINRFTLIKGNSGIGKTTLLKTLKNRKSNSCYYKISIELDEKAKIKQFSCIKKILNEITAKLLLQSNEALDKLSKSINKNLDGNGYVLTNIEPELETIIGKQKETQIKEGQAAKKQLVTVFDRFINVLLKNNTGLIILIDDIFNIDDDSLFVLSSILEVPHDRRIMIAATAESENISEKLSKKIDQIKSSKVIYNDILLETLTQKDIESIIADTLFMKNKKEIAELSQIVKKKTKGNPLFVYYFLKEISKEKLLVFDYEKLKWKYDKEALNRKGFTDNVVKLNLKGIEKLSAQTKKILKTASCIGETFSIDMLSKLLANKNVITDSVEELLKDDLIYIIDKNVYQFIHKRVKDSAYSLLNNKEAEKLHYEIAKILIKKYSEKELIDNIIEITNHYNNAEKLVETEAEKIKLAEYNALSASQSMKQNSYNQALEYIDKAISLMPDDAFEKHYVYIKKYYHRKAIIKTQLGEFDATEEILRLLLEKAKTNTEKAKMYFELVGVNTNRNKFKEAMEEGRKGLEILGITLPEDEENLKKIIIEEEEKIEKNLNGRAPMELLNAKELTDEEMLEASHILINMCSLANNIQNLTLFNACVVMGVNLILEYGNTKQSSYFFIYYASYLGRKNEPGKAYEWGRLAMRLADKYKNDDIKISVYNLFAMQINPFKNPFRKSFSILDEAYKIAIDTGNWGNAGVILVNTAGAKINEGENLTDTLKYIQEGILFTKRTKNFILVKALTILERCCLNLLGLTKSIKSFSDNAFDAGKFLEEMKTSGFGLGVNWFYYFLTEALCVYGEFDLLREKMEEYQETNKLNEDNEFFYTIALTNLYNSFSDEEKEKYLEIIKKTYENSKKDIENKKDSETDVSRSYLVLAEYNKLFDKSDSPINYYDKAIKSATSYGNPINIALCNECAGRYCKDKGFDFIAKAYTTESYFAYKSWGANGKVIDMEKKYHGYIKKPSNHQYDLSTTYTNTTTSTTSAERIDLETIIKSTQAISGEIRLENLLKKMMEIVIANAGADKGYLLLDDKGRLLIEAESFIDTDMEVLQSVPIDDKLPKLIINYVERTKKDIIVNNAVEDDMFADDPYIKQHKPKSVLCLPLLKQGQLVGMLYLENNVTAGAFTIKKTDIIKMLSSQIAISIENAKFYEDLENKIQERTNELEKANVQLEEAKKLADNANLNKSKFLANMSHELRTPLNSINGIAEGLLFGSYERFYEIEEVIEEVLEHLDKHKDDKHVSDLTKELRSLMGIIEYSNAKTYIFEKLNNEFVNNIPAEIRGDVETSIENIIEISDDEEVAIIGAYKDIINSGKYLLGLINSVLDLSKAEAGKIEVNKTNVNINDFMRLIMIDVMNYRKAKKKEDILNISLNIPENIPESVLIDNQLTRQVILNFCSNAVKYSPDGEVKIDLVYDKERIKLTVKDNGMGIKDEDKSMIFTEFGRTEEAKNSKIEGTGLGLAYSKKLIEVQGGEVGFESEYGKGSTFWFSLPNK